MQEAQGPAPTPRLPRMQWGKRSRILILLHAGGTRTCIHTPAAPLQPSELSEQRIDEALAGASLVYFDGRLAEAALKVARAARAKRIPVLVEAERLRPGLNELLAQADFVVTSASFPQVKLSIPGPALPQE